MWYIHWGQTKSNIFETFGKDIEFLIKQNPLTIWTQIDFGDGKTHIVNEMHAVNRICYYVTKKPYLKNEYIEVYIPDEE